MTTFKDLKDTLTATNDKFETKKSMLFFSSLHYKATGEKVVEGFRYFACGIDDVLAAVAARDFNALSALPFALDEDGDPDTSAVLVDLAYTESGAFVAVQPVEYQDHSPTPVADVFLLEGNDAKALFPSIKKLDQSA